MNKSRIAPAMACRNALKFARASSSLEEVFGRLLPVAGGGVLLPVSRTTAGSALGGGVTVSDEWLTAEDRCAFAVFTPDGDAGGVLGLTVHGSDAATGAVSVIAGPVAPAAVAALARWAEDTLCLDSITGDAQCTAEAGFTSGRYLSPQAKSAGQTLILTAGPSISMREAVYAADAARNGWNSQWSKYLTRFEQEFATFVGTSHAMACSSCTGALTIALTALDIGPGDEVIVPDLTWVATANAVRYVGATPVFCDIEIDTWNMDAASMEAMITPRTKCIMPVHMYGHPARMDRVMAVARKHGLYVVEDAAPAIGASWHGQPCGSFGDFAAFSFQGAKLLVTGEGGMLVTSNPALYEKALKIWDQGRNPSKVFWIDGHGLKYKMANVQAAVGLGQLERCSELVSMKRRVFGWYREGLGHIPGLHLNEEVDGAFSIYWMGSLRLDEGTGIDRETLRAELKKRNVDTRPVFPAISQYPIWGREVEPQPVALRVGRQAMNLPSGVCLRREQVEWVCRQIRQLVGAGT